MARVLDALRPLAALLAQAPDPVQTAHQVAELAAGGADGPALLAAVTDMVADGPLARPALMHAGVLDVAGDVTVAGATRLAQTLVLVEASQASGWQLVLTVPGFLRSALDAFVAARGDGARPRETTEVLRDVAAAARKRLLVAAPYLHEQFVQVLAPDVERVLAAGGRVEVITRALSLTTPARSSANVSAVTLLRETATRAGGALEVFSWEESGLGVHFKVVLADVALAYLGSANLTPGGTAAQAEVGVLLRGDGVDKLASWLEAVCAELARRRLPHSLGGPGI